MAEHTIVDGHVHLWPASAANNEGHAWMNEGEQLTTEHMLKDYRCASQQDAKSPEARGIVYVETDRRLFSTSSPDLGAVRAQKLEELRFLRSIVEGQAGEEDADILLGIVPWAPVDQGLKVFEQWLVLAEQTTGPATWERIRGFRYLLQAMTEKGAFEKLVFSNDFIAVLKAFNTGGRTLSFDVGIDQHSGGTWQLEAFVKVIERVHHGVASHQKVTFILNHLCKPDLTIGAASTSSSSDFKRWCTCMKQFASFPNVYMKLSGAFSELSTERVATTSPAEIAAHMKPWLDQVFACFGPERIMFGSDWPVCNVRGPAIEDSWRVWKDVVRTVLDDRGLSETQKQRIWSGTAAEAYRLDI